LPKEYNHLQPGTFKILEEFISLTGPYIKKLSIKYLAVDGKVLIKLLNLLPNLECLHMQVVTSTSEREEALKWDHKLTKIKRIKFIRCSNLIETLLESFGNCVISEAKLKYRYVYLNSTSSVNFQKFLKIQEKNLRKLIIKCKDNLLNDLKDLHLEYLEFHNFYEDVSLEFLKQQKCLKFLRLCIPRYTDEILNILWDLKNLETLELKDMSYCTSMFAGSTGLNNLHKLENLKRLKVSQRYRSNILDHLKFGVFNNLEDLDGSFDEISLASVKEMKRITPNLRKITIRAYDMCKVNMLLGFRETGIGESSES
jgi:hypothetical protein